MKNNLYSICCDEISTRFRDFYRSFATVIGAQITISLINTILTAIFVVAVRLPHAPLIIAITFLCGLVPIVGNLVSNTIIVFLALTVSLKLGIGALVFLIAIHKLEYFLNSKIIGDRIRNPVWLTLIALIIGERLMGIPWPYPGAGGVELSARRNVESRNAAYSAKPVAPPLNESS